MADLHGTGPLARLHDEDDAAREERHQLLATLLGAFADGELPDETMSQVDAHLLGCARCRRELLVHKVVRQRLESEPVPAAPSSLRDRIQQAVATAPPPRPAPVATPSSWWTRTRLALGIGLALLLVAGAAFAFRARATAGLESVPLASQSLLTAVYGDYRRVVTADLPGRARDLALVRAAVNFPVEALPHPDLKLIAAWTTTLEGEPAAVLAYRWKDRMLVEYLVSDQQAYRHSALRVAFEAGYGLSATEGAVRMVTWADRTGGVILVGQAPTGELWSLRNGVHRR